MLLQEYSMPAKAVVKGLRHGVPAVAESLEQVRLDAESGRGEHRQHRVDIKAFKGRGTPQAAPYPPVPAAGGSRALRDALAAVERLQVEMANLVALTHEIRSRHVHLCLHRRTATGQVSLRWRRCDTEGAHVPWKRVPEVLRCSSPELQHWYGEVDRRARELNKQEIAARYTLKRARCDAGLAPHGQVPVRASQGGRPA
jgi:hypothetical protein